MTVCHLTCLLTGAGNSGSCTVGRYGCPLTSLRMESCHPFPSRPPPFALMENQIDSEACVVSNRTLSEPCNVLAGWLPFCLSAAATALVLNNQHLTWLVKTWTSNTGIPSGVRRI